MRAMLLSTSYNSVDTVLSNLYHSFVEVAQKSYYYIKSLPIAKQPPGKLAVSTCSCILFGVSIVRIRH